MPSSWRRPTEPVHQRNMDILTAQIPKGEGTAPRKIRARFFVSPVELYGTERVEGMKLEKNRLVKDDSGTLRARGTGEYEELPNIQMVFRSIGYKGHPLKDVPFDERAGIIPNQTGRVIDPETQAPLARLYVAGWIKRGPSGVVGTNKPDAIETVGLMLEDLQQGHGAQYHQRRRRGGSGAAGRERRPLRLFCRLEISGSDRSREREKSGQAA